MKTTRYLLCWLKHASRLVALLAATALGLLPLRADQLLLEHFSQPVADNSPLGLAGWNALALSNNTAVTDFTTATPNGNYPTISRAANAGFGGVTGNAVMGQFGTATPSLLWTNTTATLHDCLITNISFYTKNNSSSSTEQIAIQIGGQWYASTQTFHDNGGNNTWAANAFVFTTAAGTWRVLDTNTLTLGSPLTSPLPGGDIEAVGVYGVMPSGKIRLDEFSVAGMPPLPPQPDQPTALPAAGVTAPTTVTLNVAVSGTPPFGYQWRKDGVALSDGSSGSGSTLSGARTRELVIATTTIADSGSYDVVVTNAYGSRTSAVLVVTVSAQVLPPSIASLTTVPASGTSEVGAAPMSITVTPGGTGPFTYQWRKSNVDLFNETNATLTLASAFTNTGSYAVVVRSAYGSITSAPPTTLTVVDTTPPVVTFPAGTTTNITIYTPFVPTYSATDNSGVAPTVTISGTVNPNACGTYTLQFTATDTANNSSVATLTVKVWLIDEHFNAATVDNSAVYRAPGWHASAVASATGLVTDYTTTGGNADFPSLSKNPTAAGAVDGLPGFLVLGNVNFVNPSLAWLDTSTLLQNQQITNLAFSTRNNDAGNEVRIAIRIYTNWYVSTTAFTDTTAGAVPWAAHSFSFSTAAAAWQTLDVSTLTLGNPLTEPLPNQSVSALGFFGTMVAGKIRIDELQVSGTAAAFLATPPVVGPPTAAPLNPIDGSAWSGTPLTFQVSATGTLPLAYQWRKNSANIPGATSNVWVLPNPGVDDSGSYDVVVSNGGGAVTSALPALTVSPIKLAINAHFNQSTNDPGIIGQAPGWHALAINLTNAMTVTDFTLVPNPPLAQGFPNLSLSAGADGTPGYMVMGQGDTVNPVLVWVAAPASLQGGHLTNVSFYTRNNFPSSTVQVAVQIAGQWYVSATTLSDMTFNVPPWMLQVFTFAPDAGLWQALDTSTLMLGAYTTAPLPNSPVTAIGLYGDTWGVASARIRIDEFQVNGSLATAAATSIQPLYLDDGGNLVLRTATAAGWNYVLESAPSLNAPVTWTPVQTTAGTGGTITNIIPVTPGTGQFFRYLLQ